MGECVGKYSRDAIIASLLIVIHAHMLALTSYYLTVLLSYTQLRILDVYDI